MSTWLQITLGVLLGLPIALLIAFPILAKKGRFFMEVGQGKMQVIQSGKKVWKIIANVDGWFYNPVADMMTRDSTVTGNPPFQPFQIFGRYLISLNPFRSLMIYTLAWNEWNNRLTAAEQATNPAAAKGMKVLWARRERTSYIAFENIVALDCRGLETGDDDVVWLQFDVGIQVLRPRLLMNRHDMENWIIQISDRLRGIIAPEVKTMTDKDLEAAQKAGTGSKLTAEAKDAINADQLLAYFGVEVFSLKFLTYDNPNQAIIAKKKTAEREADANLAEAVGKTKTAAEEAQQARLKNAPDIELLTARANLLAGNPNLAGVLRAEAQPGLTHKVELSNDTKPSVIIQP